MNDLTYQELIDAAEKAVIARIKAATERWGSPLDEGGHWKTAFETALLYMDAKTLDRFLEDYETVTRRVYPEEEV